MGYTKYKKQLSTLRTTIGTYVLHLTSFNHLDLKRLWQVHDCEPSELAGVRCLREEPSTTTTTTTTSTTTTKPTSSELAAPVEEVVKNDVGISIVDLPPGKPQEFFEPLRVR